MRKRCPSFFFALHGKREVGFFLFFVLSFSPLWSQGITNSFSVNEVKQRSCLAWLLQKHRDYFISQFFTSGMLLLKHHWSKVPLRSSAYIYLLYLMYSTNSNSLKPLLVLDFSSLIPISLGQFRRLSTKFLYCNDQGWLPDFFVIQAHNRNGVQFNTIIFESNFKKYNLNRFQIGTHFLHLVLVFTPKDYKCCSQKDMVTTRNISERENTLLRLILQSAFLY